MSKLATEHPTSLSQSHASIMIEQMVLHIAETNVQAFRIKPDRDGRDLYLSTVLSKHFTHIQSLIDHCTDQYDYSEHLQAFVSACSDIGLDRSPMGHRCGKGEHRANQWPKVESVI